MSSSYLKDFFERMKRRSNYPVLIYMLLNTYVIGELLGFFLSMPFWQSYIVGLIVYGLSLMLALSPLGEWYLRRQAGCKEITRKEYIDRLEPLYYSIYEKARQKDPSIADDVRFYMSEDPAPNAFATGRKTVCVTKGLLSLDDDQIKGILGHEFGHLAHKDTDLILLTYVGNVIFNMLIAILNLIVQFINGIIIVMIVSVVGIILTKGLRAFLTQWLARFLYAITVGLLLGLWAKIYLLLTMKSSRDNEFEADEFSFELGHGIGLCSGLDAIKSMFSSGENRPANGIFASLAASHPETDVRIARLQSLGCKYINGSGR